MSKSLVVGQVDGFNLLAAQGPGAGTGPDLLTPHKTPPSAYPVVPKATVEPRTHNLGIVLVPGTTIERVFINAVSADPLFTESSYMAFGVIIWPNPEVTTDDITFPSPMDKANSVDWMAWGVLTPMQGGVTLAIPATGGLAWSKDLDVRSKRVARERFTSLYLVVEPSVSYSLTVASSVLVRTP